MTEEKTRLGVVRINKFKSLPIIVNRQTALQQTQRLVSVEPEIIVAESLPNPQEEGLLSRALSLAGFKRR